MDARTYYEIAAYDTEGALLSLHEDPTDTDQVRVTTVWEAVAALALVPSHGWGHWDDAPSEKILIGVVRLRHVEYRRNSRGTDSCWINTLETLKRG